MADREIGYIELTATTRIEFHISSWKGQTRGEIRKFVATQKYSGRTKSGMLLAGPTLVQLRSALRVFQSDIPTPDPEQFVSVGKTRDWEIRIVIIPPDEESKLPNVDIREYIETPGWTGYTKKGVRFSWDKLKQFSQLLDVLVHELGAAVQADTGLFPEVQPAWLSDANQDTATGSHKPALHGFDAASLKSFPDAFLPDGKIEVECLALPSDRLKIEQDRNGHHFVTDDSDFHRQVRNEVEGKYFLYAQQRGAAEVRLPKEMFKVFSAVANYEKYSRELRQKLIRDLEARSRNRTLAEHMARETFETYGLPIC
jgi:hypothetical protein